MFVRTAFSQPFTLKEPGSGRQQQVLYCVLSSFQGRAERQNHICVLVLKHSYLSVWSRQVKCTLL